MRTIPAAIAASLLALVPLAAGAQGPAQGNDKAPACQAWDSGAAARKNGWTLKKLQGAQRWAMLSYYDKRVAPRTDPKTDNVLVASNPDSPALRVIIVRGNCIIDIGQMGPQVLARILSDTGAPI
jgi:hypothetical protein